jgi:hypothetical protein
MTNQASSSSAEEPLLKRSMNHEAEWSEKCPWPVMSDEAYYGLVGDIVQTISPHSEADPVAILIQVLAAAGNVIGRCRFYQVESDRHHPNLFSVLVGASSKSRKGTSSGRVRSVVNIVDPQWASDRTKSGLSSGEGFIYEVRDEVRRWNAKDQVEEVVDPGVTDKRMMIIEPEFAGALVVMERHGNTLSPLIRRAWDGDRLCALTKNSPLAATNAHISIIGHITEAELKARLTRTDAAKGFANRFLFVLVRRSKELPFGGNLSDGEILFLGERLKHAIGMLPSDITRITMTDAAKEAWAAVYSDLSADKPGLLGAVTARSEAQTIRLAMIYALLDGQRLIDVVHLRAGLAVWEYCEASAQHIFGKMLGDPVADEILRALKRAGKGGLTRTIIRGLFSGHQSSDRLSAALAMLLSKGLARVKTRESRGRPTEVWYAQEAQ